jgi:hypothetical protein
VVKLPVNYNELSQPHRRLVRETYVKLQDNTCYHCGGSFQIGPTTEMLKKSINLKLFPTGFLKYPIHLHHSHDTGLTIGAVHARCNAILWQYHGE